MERELRAPSAGEVRVKVLATIVCGPDIHVRRGQTPIAPKMPFVWWHPISSSAGYL
jgi:Zn-dependent alcohol dehydrogenase